MSIDWEKVAGLLHITEKARQWPSLRSLHDAALKELEGHSKEAKKALDEEMAKAQMKEAARAEEAAKKRRAEEDAAKSKPRPEEIDPVKIPTPADEPIQRRTIE